MGLLLSGQLCCVLWHAAGLERGARGKSKFPFKVVYLVFSSLVTPVGLINQSVKIREVINKDLFEKIIRVVK